MKVCPGTYHEYVTFDHRPGVTLAGVEPWTAVLMPPVVVTGTAGETSALIDIQSSNYTRVRWLSLLVPSSGDCDYELIGIRAFESHHVRIRSNRLSGGGANTTNCGLLSGILFDEASAGQIAYNAVKKFAFEGITSIHMSNARIYRNSIRLSRPEVCPGSVAACTAGVGGSPQVGISIAKGFGTAERNVITTNSGQRHEGDSIGIQVVQANATVKDNRVRTASTGIFVSFSAGTVSGNDVRGGNKDGIWLKSAETVTVDNSRVTQQGGAGIFADDQSTGNTIDGNNFSGNGDDDCVDQTGDGGSDPVDNTWTGNLGDESNPAGICAPAP